MTQNRKRNLTSARAESGADAELTPALANTERHEAVQSDQCQPQRTTREQTQTQQRITSREDRLRIAHFNRHRMNGIECGRRIDIADRTADTRREVRG